MYAFALMNNDNIYSWKHIDAQQVQNHHFIIQFQTPDIEMQVKEKCLTEVQLEGKS